MPGLRRGTGDSAPSLTRPIAASIDPITGRAVRRLADGHQELASCPLIITSPTLPSQIGSFFAAIPRIYWFFWLKIFHNVAMHMK
jgi:hypothetical protein